MTSDQVRAARGALGWTQSELAKRASVSLRSVRRIEAGQAPTPVIANAVSGALRAGGCLIFTDPRMLAGLADFAFGIAIRKGAAISSSRS